MKAITTRMSGDEAALWTKLSTFEIDGPDTNRTQHDRATSGLTFAARLSRKNGWSAIYTRRVIEEYRKFLFLCCVTPTGVTPSDPVDQAWHLHLTYTKSYWVDLCRNTLGRDIHHNPTKGGVSERVKFDGMYSHSQTLYSRYFCTVPPADIWHDNQQRFSDIDFERVNKRTNWIIRKPDWVRVKPLLVGLSALLVAGLFVQAASGAVIAILGGVAFFSLIYGLSKLAAANTRKQEEGAGGDGGASGCGSVDSGHGHHGDHGGDSGDGGGGDSGCSGSGCSSGCGGGCGGGGD